MIPRIGYIALCEVSHGMRCLGMSSVDTNECSHGGTMIAMSLSSRVNVDRPRPGQETATNFRK